MGAVPLDNMWLTAALWIGLALAAGVVSLRLGVAVALIELAFGFLAGNLLGQQPTPWIDFLAGLGAILLTFMAGAEVDPVSFRRHLKASLTLGFIAFAVPFAAAFGFTQAVLGWNTPAALLAGIVLSETSVAVVYAVTVEAGLNQEEVGKLLLAACFVNGALMMGALGLFFVQPTLWLAAAVAATALALWQGPRVTRWVLRSWGSRLAELEVKFLLLSLLFLGGLARQAGSEPVLPAYLLGIAVAGLFVHNPTVVRRLRSIAFALLTPFFFLKAGVLVPAGAVASAGGMVAVLLVIKMAAKALGVGPAARILGIGGRDGAFLTLLMSTGLTLGNIAAVYGLEHDILTADQYALLVAVVFAAAIVPTLIAQRWFFPRPSGEARSTPHAPGQ